MRLPRERKARMDAASWIHLGVTAFLFLCFIGCLLGGLEGSRWWLVAMVAFLVAATLAAGWAGWSIA